MNGVDLLALVLASVLEGEAGNTGGCFGSDDFQAFHDARNDFVLDAGVKTFGVLANNDQINIGITSGDVRKITDRTKIRIELKLFPQLDVDAGKAAADRGGDRALQSYTRALD